TTFQILERVQNCMVLGFIRNHMSAGRARTFRQSKHRQIARLSPTTRKNYFVRLDVEKRGNLVSSIVNRRTRLASGGVNARWISEMPAQVRQHRVARFVAERSSRVVIEINHPRNAPLGSAALCGRLGTMRNCFSS